MEHAILCNTLSKPRLSKQKSIAKQKISFFAVCLLGFGRMMGVRCKYWNRGLEIDLTYLYIFGGLLSLHMLILASSIAEMTGALPFTGGTYGFARGIYGSFLGFLVGILEIFTGLACMAAFIHGFGEACITALRLPSSYLVVFFLLLIVSTAFVQSLDIYRFSWVVRIFILFAAAFTLIYVFSPLATEQSEHSHYAHVHTETSGSHAWQDILSFSPTCAFFFTGVEMLPIIAHDSRDPRRAVPRALIFVTCMSTIAMFVTYTISTQQPPGVDVLRDSQLPLSYGFANLLNISVETAMLFNLPFQISSYMVSQYFLCIIIRSMAESGLLPSLFLKEWSVKKYQMTFTFPYYSASMTLTLSALAAVMAWLMKDVSDSVSMSFVYFFAFPYYTLYIALFLTFITFRKHFASLPRSFVSPFGVIGAYLGMGITFFFIISTCFFAYNAVALGAYVLMIAVLMLIYRYIVHRHETFSGEEEKVFFPTYVIRSNQNQQKRMRKTAAMLRNQQTMRNANQQNSTSYRSVSESPSNKSISWGERLGLQRNSQTESRNSSPKHHSHKPPKIANSTNSSKYHPTSVKVVPVTTISEKDSDRSESDHVLAQTNQGNPVLKPVSHLSHNTSGSERVTSISAAGATQGNSSSTLSTYASSQSHTTTSSTLLLHHHSHTSSVGHDVQHSNNHQLLTQSLLETTASTANSSNKTSVRMNLTHNNSVKNSAKQEHAAINKLAMNSTNDSEAAVTMITENTVYNPQLLEEEHEEEDALLRVSTNDAMQDKNKNSRSKTDCRERRFNGSEALIISDLESSGHREEDEEDAIKEQNQHQIDVSNEEDGEEELTFEEALASSEDDIKLRYIRQHLHQMFASSHKTPTNNDRDDDAAGHPVNKTRRSMFFGSFFFPPTAANPHILPPPSNHHSSHEHPNHASSNNLVDVVAQAPVNNSNSTLDNVNTYNDHISHGNITNTAEAPSHLTLQHPQDNTLPHHRPSIIDALRLPLWWRTSTLAVGQPNHNTHNSFSAAVSRNSSGHSSNKNNSNKSNVSQKNSDKAILSVTNSHGHIKSNDVQNPSQIMAMEDVLDDV